MVSILYLVWKRLDVIYQKQVNPKATFNLKPVTIYSFPMDAVKFRGERQKLFMTIGNNNFFEN